MAEQADRLRVAQLERNKNRKRWWQWLGDAQLSAMKVNETACVLPSDPAFERR